jgi:peptide/nickel transport system permease protein
VIVRDILQGWNSFWRDFTKVKVGVAGLAILVFFFVLAVVGPWFIAAPEAASKWRTIDYWQDNPQSAPPAWTAWLPGASKGVVSADLTHYDLAEEDQDGGVKVKTFSFDYNFDAALPPKDLIVQFEGEGQVPVQLTVTRPDGLVAELYREQLTINAGEVQRISVTRNTAQALVAFVQEHNEALASGLDQNMIRPASLLFAQIKPDMDQSPTPLNGHYTFALKALLLTDDSALTKPHVVVSGNVSGIMGTDTAKRDVWSGIVVGTQWALLIGFFTSIITVVVGVLLGIVAAYFGGVIDWVVNRVYEFVYLLPLLPFLIVTSAIYKPSIGTLIVLICLFFWTGPFKPVYSMALQIREETYVEASRALGASPWRIILSHVAPVLLPYSFAMMALSIPAVIVYEASISFLGLGDTSIVTWGQLLHDAMGQGAVINNLWWWIVPPGLMIALMGMSFAFLGTALDKVLHPKLKTR